MQAANEPSRENTHLRFQHGRLRLLPTRQHLLLHGTRRPPSRSEQSSRSPHKSTKSNKRAVRFPTEEVDKMFSLQNPASWYRMIPEDDNTYHLLARIVGTLVPSPPPPNTKSCTKLFTRKHVLQTDLEASYCWVNTRGEEGKPTSQYNHFKRLVRGLADFAAEQGNMAQSGITLDALETIDTETLDLLRYREEQLHVAYAPITRGTSRTQERRAAGSVSRQARSGTAQLPRQQGALWHGSSTSNIGGNKEGARITRGPPRARRQPRGRKKRLWRLSRCRLNLTGGNNSRRKPSRPARVPKCATAAHTPTSSVPLGRLANQACKRASPRTTSGVLQHHPVAAPPHPQLLGHSIAPVTFTPVVRTVLPRGVSSNSPRRRRGRQPPKLSFSTSSRPNPQPFARSRTPATRTMPSSIAQPTQNVRERSCGSATPADLPYLWLWRSVLPVRGELSTAHGRPHSGAAHQRLTWAYSTRPR